jgi:hypothetical protein
MQTQIQEVTCACDTTTANITTTLEDAPPLKNKLSTITTTTGKVTSELRKYVTYRLF